MGGQLLVEDQVGLKLRLAVFVQNGVTLLIDNLTGTDVRSNDNRRILQCNRRTRRFFLLFKSGSGSIERINT